MVFLGQTAFLFNHESPRRGNSFVTKKIVESIAQIKRGKIKSFKLGNLDAKKRLGICSGIC